jgi:exodeoxyribonuclease VII large subunit
VAPGLNEVLVDLHPDALSIADLYDEVEGALNRSFPRGRPIWVRGEVQSISDRTGHCYIDLVDPDGRRERQAPVLKVKCWKMSWGPLKRTLRREGIELAPGMVVLLRGQVDFYRARAEVNFILSELDVTALLGRLAAQRAALLRALAAEGLLERNRNLTVPAVPLAVGLVASPGTEGCNDFIGQLVTSGFAFAVSVVPASVQGKGAPHSIVRALRALADRDCDVVVVVRGGGSKADLAAFDSEPVARTIATMPVPVWTGIGHTGDESVADIVAHRTFVTPTDCGHELVLAVAEWWEERVARPAAVVGRRAEDVLAAAVGRDTQARDRLTSGARHQLRWHGQRLAGRTAALVEGAPRVVVEARGSIETRAGALGPLVHGHVARAGDQMVSWRRLLAAYDVERQLERGYTLTLDPAGRVVRSAAGLTPGDGLVTRFADGTARSSVDRVTVSHAVADAPASSEETDGP